MAKKNGSNQPMENLKHKLHFIDFIPEGLLSCHPEELTEILPGPTLISLPGKLKQPLFIATLLHGNETTGFRALQQYLQQPLARNTFIFIGNVRAASCNLRHLNEQLDFNRIWDNSGNTLYHEMAQSLLRFLADQDLFVAIDIHNNSGKNPHYACVNKLEPEFLQLASLFKRKIVYFTRPKEVLSIALMPFCPTIVLECGQSDHDGGIASVLDFFKRLDRIKHFKITPNLINTPVYQTIVKVVVPENKSLSFNSHILDVNFRFVEHIENFNFEKLPINTLLGWRKNSNDKLLVFDDSDREVGDLFFDYSNNEIRLKKEVIPSMFTKDVLNIQLDCLGYFMKEMIVA